MKIFVFFAEISAKFRVSEVGETKEGGEMSKEEISVNFAKNRTSGWKISEKNRFISVYFGDFSAKKTEIFLPVQPAHRIQNLIMICRQSLCFSAWLKNRGFRVREI